MTDVAARTQEGTGAALRQEPVAVPILLVDDNATKRLALKAVLTPLGYDIVEADSGRAALRAVMRRDFAVILLDVRMPVMGGFETAALIRQRRQSELTPIIFITAYASDQIMPADRYVEGAVDFIFAPVSPPELRAKVSVFANLFSRAEVLAQQARDVQAAADQLQLLTDAAPVGIFRTDTDDRYVYTNARWSEITGVSPQDACGRDRTTVFHLDPIAEPPGPPRHPDPGPGGTEVCSRVTIPVPGQAPRVALMTARSVPVEDGPDGRAAGWVGTLADVTAEVDAAAALADARDRATEASQLKSDFLANMSHEIRTPMNGVLGMTEILLHTDLDADQRDFAQTIRSSGEALLTVLSDILDFSTMSGGGFVLDMVDVDFRDVVSSVVDLLAGSARSRGLALRAEVEPAVPALVPGDPGRVRQVLANLVANGLKFTAVGEVVVRVAVTGNVPARAVRFEVSDTGVGVDPGKMATIFQPFVQADTSSTRRYGGTGLGLSISSRLVALMGGECGASSEPGAGSTFWFALPLEGS